MMKMSKQITEQIVGTKSAYQLNHELFPNVDFNKFETFGDLCRTYGINIAGNYFMGVKKFGNSEMKFPLTESTSMKGIVQIICASTHIGG